MGFIGPHHNRHQTGGLQHLLARQIREEIGDSRFSSYFKFAVVRNPFDRLVSQFAHMRTRPDLREFLGMHENAPFSEYLDLIHLKRHVQWEPQCSFLFDSDETLLVDFVARFEMLDRDMPYVFTRLGLGCSVLPHINASDRSAYQEYYTSGMRVRVENMYREDLDKFDYTF